MYKETMDTLTVKFSKCVHETSIDMDASANDACQWAELKNTVDTYLINKIEDKIRDSFSSWIHKPIMDKILRIMKS